MTYKDKLVGKLKKAYLAHGKIVLGVDFDDTIFPYSDDSVEANIVCTRVRELIHEVKPYAVLCLWTVANEWSLKYKRFICENHFGMPFDHYNDSPIFSGEDVRKPHFNILLDDSSGLGESITALKEFLEWVESKKESDDTRDSD